MSYWPEFEDLLPDTSHNVETKDTEVSLQDYHPVASNVIKAIKENRSSNIKHTIKFKTTWYVNNGYAYRRWHKEIQHFSIHNNSLLNYVTDIPNELEWDEFKDNMIKEKGYFVHIEMFDCEESMRAGRLELLRPLTPGNKNKILIAVDNNGLPHAFRNQDISKVDLFELQELLKECTKDNLEYTIAVKDNDSYIAYCRSRIKNESY